MLEETIGTVAVVDFGGQYTHLIARRIRNLGLFSRIFAPESFAPDEVPGLVGIILSGGPQSVTEPGSARLPFSPTEAPVPVLGLCYGHQLLAASAGGTVSRDGRREYGLARIACAEGSPLFAGLDREQTVWMSHGDHVERLPEGFRAIASTGSLPVAAFESGDGRLFGLQFHPEVSHTPQGMRILDNFLSRCTADRNWQAAQQESALVERIRAEAGDRPLFLLASGGVDSLVTLALCIRAVGPDRVVSLHVDTGFMRKNESAEVMDHLERLGFRNLHIADASERYFRELAGKVEPEEKRRIIGRLFVEVLQDNLERLGLSDDWMLVQGTIYPDTIESGGTEKAEVIKTHHNRVAEIEAMLRAGRVIEPLDQFYKDEVRELGLALGLPESLVNRHPFPGPGLGIRILCSDGAPEPVAEEAAAHLAALCERHGLQGRILPVRSVGVQGDSRTYEHPAVIWCPPGTVPDWDRVQACATEASNRIPSVNRAVFSLAPLDDVDFTVQALHLEPHAVARLQEVDAVVRRRLEPVAEVWQVPVVMLPLQDAAGNGVYVIRPVTSRDAMTADFYRMPFDDLAALGAETARVGCGALLIDVTSKPPGTIEWE
jgi:GMP synthase (glutamine-hydrolysing)